jgi:hypothetical protein
VIQSKANYNELVDKDLGEDKEELLQVEKHAHNEELFVELEHNQKFWFTWSRSTSTRASFKVNGHTTIAYYSKSQQMRCVVCRSIQQEIIGESSTQIGKD